MAEQALGRFPANDLRAVSVAGVHADVMLNDLIACGNSLKLPVDLVVKLMPPLGEPVVKHLLGKVMTFRDGLNPRKVHVSLSLWPGLPCGNHFVNVRFVGNAVFGKELRLVKNVRLVQVKRQLSLNLEVLFGTAAKVPLVEDGDLFPQVFHLADELLVLALDDCRLFGQDSEVFRLI